MALRQILNTEEALLTEIFLNLFHPSRSKKRTHILGPLPRLRGETGVK